MNSHSSAPSRVVPLTNDSLETQLRATLNMIPAYTWYAMPSEGLTFVKTRAAEYLGLPSDHPLRFGIDTGAAWDSRIASLHSEDHAETRRICAASLETGAPGEVSCLYANRASLAYTGGTLERWQHSESLSDLHPDDARRLRVAAEWFDVAKFPQATFSSTNVALAGSGDATITGNLTLHGVTKPVVLHAHLLGAGVNPIDKMYTVGFQASGTIKRTDFGVSMYAPALGDEVELSIAGAFEIQG